MSLQNLLEMEDFGRSFSPTDKNADMPKPKPRPRARPSKLLSPTVAKRDGNINDVMSITSAESGNNNSPRKKESPSKTYAKLHPASNSAFDNVAFVTDEEPVSEASDKRKDLRPKALKRNSLMGSPLAKTLVKQKESYKVSSQDEDSENGNVGPTTVTDDDWKYFSSPGRKKGDDDDDDSRSDATFTVENEKYKDKGLLSKKPPKPKSSPPVSRIPKPQPHQRKSVKKETPILPPVERSKKTDIKKKVESETEGTEATPEKKKEEYVTVPIDTEDGEGASATDGNNDKRAGDESETASVSSSVPPPKDSKKSRFGKFFGSSDNKKYKNPPSDKDKNSSAENDEKHVGKQSLVNRWRKSAHTFLKTSSKPIDEEAPEDDTKDESKSSKLSPSKSEKHKTKPKSGDSRIIMPESGSENDDMGSSANSDDDNNDITKEKNSREKVKELKGKPKADDKPDEIKPTKERFKSFDKLLRNRSKEKQAPSLKSVDDKREDDDLITDAEKGTKRSKTKFKETASKLVKEQKLDKKMLTKHAKVKTSDSSSSEEQDKDLESNSDLESGTDLPVKKPKSPKRRQERKPSEPLQLIDTVSQKELLFGLTIHSSDLLPLDPNVIHPVVKVTVMLQNGQYMKRSNPDERNEGKSRQERKSKHRKRKQSGVMEVTENIAESILPIMSQPCQARHTIPTFAPTWNELLVFEEPFRRFVSRSEPNNSEHDPIILFEVMDFLPMSGNGNSTSVSGFHGSDDGWYKVAWAFLKPIGGNGVMNVNRKLRLQLYKPIKLRRKEKLSGPEIFSWWKTGRREKVNATLYVTPKGIQPPETRTASLRQLLSMRKEHLTQAILDSQLATKKKKKEKSKRPSLFELREQANWSRMEGQSCKPPNKLAASLPSSQIESLNIVISGNVHCTKFSPCGYKLAAGFDTDELHVILIFEVPSWTLVKSLTGHHGIIYDIAWKLFELDDYTSYHYMASASADSTVRIWKMDNHQEKTISLFKVLYHPSYVYTVKFHPTHPSLLASGCFDGIIRIWDVKPEHALDLAEKKKKSRKREAKDNQIVTILLDKHNSFVNCLVFDKVGQYMYSGDGSAYLYKWSCANPSQRKSWKLERDAKMHHGNVPINSIDLHPSGNRILLHLRDNFIKILDASSFIPLQTLPGLHNERFQIRSCFSPCGNLVLSGSEENTLCIWDADTGKILQFINPRSYPQCTVTCVDYHPVDYYIAIGLSSGISEPSPVMVYFYNQPSKMNYPMLKKTAIKMRESMEKSRSQSLDTDEGNMSGRTRSDMLSAKRGSSTEKFVSIIQKLDSALYLAHQRNKRRETEAKSSTCITTKKAPESEAKNIPQPTQKDIVEIKRPQMIPPSTPSGRKIGERPRSATSISRERRDRTKELTPQRDAKSDSEQCYQLHASDKLALKKVKPTSRTKTRRSKIDEIGRESIPAAQLSSSFHFKSTNNKSFDIDSSDY